VNAPASERTPARRAVPRVSVMFSLEIASIAAYLPLLSLHAREGLGLTPLETSMVFATGPLTAMIGPPIAGFLADRVFRAERALALSSLLRVGTLLLAARADTFPELLLAMALHGFFAGQSGVFVSTIAFSHLPDTKRFGVTRVWGTLSWVVMVLAVASVIGPGGSRAAEIATLHWTFYAAALTALAQSAYALSLPPTVPRRGRREGGPGFRMRELFRSPPFVAALVVAILYGSLAQWNLILQGLFFADENGLALSPATAGRASTVSQILEIALLPVLGILIDRFGLRRIVLVGIAAWVLRYAAYYAGGPTWLVVSAQLLHGPNFVMGFVGLQLAVELTAPVALRGRAQAAFATASLGIGSLIGQLACGALLSLAARPGGRVDWQLVFAIPLVVSVIATVITAVWVRNPERLGTDSAVM
jgi:MFS family permease